MSVKELKLDGGLTDLRVNDVVSEDGEYLVLTIETRRSFKGDSSASMLAMLDRKQQHLLMLYLQERLQRS